MTIHYNDLVWHLKLAPPLAKAFTAAVNDLYFKGLKGQECRYDKSWTDIFRARADLLEVAVNVYTIGQVCRLLSGLPVTVVVYPNDPPMTVPPQQLPASPFNWNEPSR